MAYDAGEDSNLYVSNKQRKIHFPLDNLMKKTW